MKYTIVNIYYTERSEKPEVMYLIDENNDFVCILKDVNDFNDYLDFNTLNVVLSDEVPKAVYAHQMRER